MRWSARLEQAQHVACCLLAATIPLLFIWSTLSIWAIIICWALSGRFASTWRHFRAQPAYWLWVIYFALHAASYFWSSDKDQSLFDTVSKLSFVVLPIVVGAGANICRRRFEQILGSFILGISAVTLFCLGQAFALWRGDGDDAHFFYHDLVKGFDANAVYMAWYVFCALSALLLINWQYLFRDKWRLLNWALATILLVFLVLLSSRFGRLGARYGPRLFMSLGPAIMALGLLWLTRIPPDSQGWVLGGGRSATILPPADYFTDLLPGLVVFGIGLSIIDRKSVV